MKIPLFSAIHQPVRPSPSVKNSPAKFNVSREKIGAYNKPYENVGVFKKAPEKLLVRQPRMHFDRKLFRQNIEQARAPESIKTEFKAPAQKEIKVQAPLKAIQPVPVKAVQQAPVQVKAPVMQQVCLPKAPVYTVAAPLPKTVDPARTSPITGKNVEERIEIAKLSNEANKYVNLFRAHNNLPPLAFSPAILPVAQDYARQLASTNGPLTHDGVDQRFDEVKRRTGATRQGENLGLNLGLDNPAKVAVGGWIKSPTHRANLLGDFNSMAIGAAQNEDGTWYFVQLLAKI